MLLLKEKEYCKNLRSSFKLSNFVVAVENKSHRDHFKQGNRKHTLLIAF